MRIHTLTICLFLALASLASAETRPNILWITAEDMSPTLGCYGDAYATTPHIDALAKESVRYTQSFATTPVCSPARACLINGIIATTQGAHQMRSVFPLPKQLEGFPSRLRKAGYYTTNNSKTDYNSGNAERISRLSWNENSAEAHWRNRKPGQPFFSVFNLMTSHQSRSMVWSYAQFREEVQSQLAAKSLHDPAKAPIPPYYPNTPLVRKTVARFYDCVTLMDRQVGEVLAQLKADGLEDSTIVFFYSDHGSGMPRHKRALFDSGMRIPLLVRTPARFRRARHRPGGLSTELITFEDMAPTVLQLAGLESPEWMTGHSFLGEKESARRYVHGHRDRVDEIVDLARSVRDRRFLYIRNYMPHLGYNQQSAWIDQGEVRRDFYQLAKSPQKMTPAQRQYLGPGRPVEELYDCERDPLNLNNLAGDDNHSNQLQRLRSEHQRWVRHSRDLGFIPETELWGVAMNEPPMAWARSNAPTLQRAFAAAQRVGVGSVNEFRDLLASPEPAVRYWGAVGLAGSRDFGPTVHSALRNSLKDETPIVRIEAANALARHGDLEAALAVLKTLLKDDDTTVLLYAARTVELLGDEARSARKDMQQLHDRFEHEPGDPAWFIRFTTSGFLSRIDND